MVIAVSTNLEKVRSHSRVSPAFENILEILFSERWYKLKLWVLNGRDQSLIFWKQKVWHRFCTIFIIYLEWKTGPRSFLS